MSALPQTKDQAFKWPCATLYHSLLEHLKDVDYTMYQLFFAGTPYGCQYYTGSFVLVFPRGHALTCDNVEEIRLWKARLQKMFSIFLGHKPDIMFLQREPEECMLSFETYCSRQKRALKATEVK